METLITEQSYPNSYGYDEETFIKKPLVYSMSMKYGRFWSNTSNSKNIHLAYGVNFNRKRKNSQSKNGTKEKDKTRYIRCVRLWGNEEIENEWCKISDSAEIETIELFLKKYFGASSKWIKKAINKLEELHQKREKEFASLSPLEKKILFLQENNKNTPTITLLKNGIEYGGFDSYKCEALSMLKELMKEENKWKESTAAKNPEKDKAYKQTVKVLEWLKECK